jgi:hypothetical protein
VFVSVGILLARFAWFAAAERALTQAAAAGATEATLPRATRATIQSVVAGRLQAAGLAGAAHPVSVERNGEAVWGACHARAGDRFTVAVAVNSPDVLPAWLCRLSGRPQSTLLTGCAVHTVHRQ